MVETKMDKRTKRILLPIIIGAGGILFIFIFSKALEIIFALMFNWVL